MGWVLLAVGVGIIVGLSVVAVHLWSKVFRQQAAQAMQQQLAVEAEQKKLEHIFESLNVIAVSVLEKQCPISEGCIRMSVLLDQLPLSCEMKHRFRPLFEVHQQLAHIPTHSRWKALDKKQRWEFEKLIRRVEQEYETGVNEALQWVKDNPFGRIPARSLH